MKKRIWEDDMQQKYKNSELIIKKWGLGWGSYGKHENRWYKYYFKASTPSLNF